MSKRHQASNFLTIAYKKESSDLARSERWRARRERERVRRIQEIKGSQIATSQPSYVSRITIGADIKEMKQWKNKAKTMENPSALVAGR